MAGRAVVVGEHTLGCVFSNGLQILRASVLRGSYFDASGLAYFDSAITLQWRLATEQDFHDFGVMPHPDYFEGVVS